MAARTLRRDASGTAAIGEVVVGVRSIVISSRREAEPISAIRIVIDTQCTPSKKMPASF
jgi:hypothetical protein